jgi:hypothetical protein
MVADQEGRQSFHFELVLFAEQLLKGHPRGGKPLGRRGVDVPSRPKSVQVSTLEERSLLSFQRPVPVCLAA